ncbi:hypothetical protein [Cerasicoccus fimbriatus]|uniref:hypothetical protein n=1 Tax=Cerasicoccus fimbriatus TaxID=3014554 RepID=UPI0022B2FB58|nr:hypothetical protein [Cerasicoccus sp. TK19100]
MSEYFGKICQGLSNHVLVGDKTLPLLDFNLEHVLLKLDLFSFLGDLVCFGHQRLANGGARFFHRVSDGLNFFAELPISLVEFLQLGFQGAG